VLEVDAAAGEGRGGERGERRDEKLAHCDRF
jgi:hypothetical protein